MLVACRIGTKANSLYSRGKKREGMEKDSKLLIAGRDITVSELCMEDKAEFGKVGIQWLVGLVPLIGEEGILFGGLYESGVHVEGGMIDGIPFVDSSDEVGIDTFKGG